MVKTEFIRQQLTQGVTPNKLALTFALGLTLGIFPILGTTTLLCLFAGLMFELNQPILQALNYTVYPLQIVLLPGFIWSGEKLFRSESISFTPSTMTREFAHNPTTFMSKYGAVGFHAVAVWGLVAPGLALITYSMSLFLLRRLQKAGRNRAKN